MILSFVDKHENESNDFIFDFIDSSICFRNDAYSSNDIPSSPFVEYKLYKQYIEKQKILNQLNDETIKLQNEFNNTLKSINDNYQTMKSEAAQQHKKLLDQLQSKFDVHQTADYTDKNHKNHNDDTNDTQDTNRYSKISAAG